MGQTKRLFAIASAMFLVFGLFLANFMGTNLTMGLGWPGATIRHDVSFHAACYFIAAVFGVFACVYAIRRIPFNKKLSKWHFWLSTAGTMLYAFGYAFLVTWARDIAGRGQIQASQGAVGVALIGLVLGPLCFVSGQILFVIGFVQAVPKIGR